MKCPLNGKVMYATRSEAKLQLKRMLQHGFSRTGKLSVYRCKVCKHFHVGNKKPWLKKLTNSQKIFQNQT